MKTYFICLLYLNVLLILCSCKNGIHDQKNEGSANFTYTVVLDSNGMLDIKSSDIGIEGVLDIDLEKYWDKYDTFCFDNLSDSYRGKKNIIFNFIGVEDNLIEAYSIVSFDTYLWADMTDDVIQYISPTAFTFKQKERLHIKDNNAIYPHPEETLSKEGKKYYQNITREQVVNAVEKYFSDGSHDEKERKVYLKLASKYKEGNFVDNKQDKFDVNPNHFEVVLKYKGANGIYEKRIVYSKVIGN